ncbi:hypothetical protein N9N28_16265 [Rubripirellula amarantea]|nr:hypothetical protein [Rubripirellula amarantea]
MPHEKLFTSPTLFLREMAPVGPLTVGFHAVARGDVCDTDTSHPTVRGNSGTAPVRDDAVTIAQVLQPAG